MPIYFASNPITFFFAAECGFLLGAFVAFTAPFKDYLFLITRGDTFNLTERRLEHALNAALQFHPLIWDCRAGRMLQ